MLNTEFQFLPNVADENEGLGDAGIETFRDAPYASVARECGQNSGDAHDNSNRAVILYFDVNEVEADQVPGMESLRQSIAQCYAKALDENNEKEVDFFENAKQVAGLPEVSILTVSDYHTRGLQGPCTSGTPFHSLIKAKGVSSDKDADSGGSFGIGKNALFAVSDLQTAFYSTLYEDSNTGEEVFLAQGKTVLVSHTDTSCDPRLATGYWGRQSYQPVELQDEVPEWMHRKEQGTSVHSIGFRRQENWQYRMAASLLKNFFCAVHRGQMEFWVNDGEIAITKQTIRELFNDVNIVNAAEESNLKEEFEFSRDLYECLVSQESKIVTVEIDRLGEVEIRVLDRDGLPKRMCIVRNGMVITDSLEKFGDKFAAFPLYRDFVAMVEPKTKTGSALIKSLENPKHDGVSAERISNPEKKLNAEKAMQALRIAIRKAIKSVTYSKPKNKEIIDEMAEFFSDEDKSQGIQDPNSDDDPEKYTYNAKKSRKERKIKQPGSGEGTEGGAGASGEGSGAGGSGSGSGDGTGTGGSGTRNAKPVAELTGLRNCKVGPSNSERKVFFTSIEAGDIQLTIYASGMSDREKLTVKNCDKGTIRDGLISINTAENERVALSIEFESAYAGPIELSAVKGEI